MPKIVKQTRKPSKPSRGGGVLDRIKPIGFDEDEGISLCLYGRSGTGKTTLWGSFPGKILAIICSGGKRPGELRSLDTPEHRKKIDQVVIESSEEVYELVNYQRESETYSTLVIDHLTSLQHLILKEILGVDELPQQLSWGLASQQQYGQCSLKMKELLNAVLSLACNRVLVAQERAFDESEGNDIILPYVGAALSPSVAGWLNSSCDYIAQTFLRRKTVTKQVKVGSKTVTKEFPSKEIQYCLRVGAHDVFTTKFRAPKGSLSLPEAIVDPTYDKIIKLIRGA